MDIDIYSGKKMSSTDSGQNVAEAIAATGGAVLGMTIMATVVYILLVGVCLYISYLTIKWLLSKNSNSGNNAQSANNAQAQKSQ